MQAVKEPGDPRRERPLEAWTTGKQQQKQQGTSKVGPPGGPMLLGDTSSLRPTRHTDACGTVHPSEPSGLGHEMCHCALA